MNKKNLIFSNKSASAWSEPIPVDYDVEQTRTERDEYDVEHSRIGKDEENCSREELGLEHDIVARRYSKTLLNKVRAGFTNEVSFVMDTLVLLNLANSSDSCRASAASDCDKTREISFEDIPLFDVLFAIVGIIPEEANASLLQQYKRIRKVTKFRFLEFWIEMCEENEMKEEILAPIVQLSVGESACHALRFDRTRKFKREAVLVEQLLLIIRCCMENESMKDEFLSDTKLWRFLTLCVLSSSRAIKSLCMECFCIFFSDFRECINDIPDKITYCSLYNLLVSDLNSDYLDDACSALSILIPISENFQNYDFVMSVIASSNLLHRVGELFEIYDAKASMLLLEWLLRVSLYGQEMCEQIYEVPALFGSCLKMCYVRSRNLRKVESCFGYFGYNKNGKKSAATSASEITNAVESFSVWTNRNYGMARNQVYKSCVSGMKRPKMTGGVFTRLSAANEIQLIRYLRKTLICCDDALTNVAELCCCIYYDLKLDTFRNIPVLEECLRKAFVGLLTYDDYIRDGNGCLIYINGLKVKNQLSGKYKRIPPEVITDKQYVFTSAKKSSSRRKAVVSRARNVKITGKTPVKSPTKRKSAVEKLSNHLSQRNLNIQTKKPMVQITVDKVAAAAAASIQLDVPFSSALQNKVPISSTHQNSKPVVNDFVSKKTLALTPGLLRSTSDHYKSKTLKELLEASKTRGVCNGPTTTVTTNASNANVLASITHTNDGNNNPSLPIALNQYSTTTTTTTKTQSKLNQTDSSENQNSIQHSRVNNHLGGSTPCSKSTPNHQTAANHCKPIIANGISTNNDSFSTSDCDLTDSCRKETKTPSICNELINAKTLANGTHDLNCSIGNKRASTPVETSDENKKAFNFDVNEILDEKERVSKAQEYIRNVEKSACLCEWDFCTFTSDNHNLLFSHICNAHLLNASEGICRWYRCVPHKRAKYALVSHIQDVHCEKTMLAARRMEKLAALRSGSEFIPSCELHPTIYSPDAALSSLKMVFRDMNRSAMCEKRTANVAWKAEILENLQFMTAYRTTAVKIVEIIIQHIGERAKRNLTLHEKEIREICRQLAACGHANEEPVTLLKYFDSAADDVQNDANIQEAFSQLFISLFGEKS